MTGQRGVTAILFLLLIVAGALFGHPGALPTGADGQTITPEFILNLIAPIGLLIATVVGVFKGISARVETGQIKAGDLLALGGLSEFWLGLVNVVVFTAQTFFKVDLLTPEQQSTVADALMAIFAGLLHSFGQRSPGLPAPAALVAEKAVNGVYKVQRE